MEIEAPIKIDSPIEDPAKIEKPEDIPIKETENTKDTDDDGNIIVIDENTGEDMLMECEDEILEPLESSAEFIDYDNPIQYTDEQMSFNLLNLLSFNDKDVLKNKTFWNRRAREFVDVFKIQSAEDKLNSKLLPIIIANKIVVIDEDDVIEDEERDAELANIFLTETTMKDILENRTNLSKSKEPFITNFPTSIKLERIWTLDNVIANEKSIPTKIKHDTFGYLYMRDTTIRRVHLLGQIQSFKEDDDKNLYDGDNVNITGFVYMINPAFETITFNPNTYLQDLKNMNIGDKVIVYFNYDNNRRTGKIKTIDSDKITVSITTGKTEDIKISKIELHTNDYFIYPYDTPNIFYKYMLKENNVSFILLDSDNIQDTIKMMTLDVAEVLYLWRPQSKNIYSILDFYKRLYDYGLVVNDINEKAFLSIKDLIDDNSLKIIQNTPSKNPVKKKYTKILKSNIDLLDFKKHEIKLSSYKPYLYTNHLGDTEYNRGRYILNQGDNGLIYYTQFVQDYGDMLFTMVDKNKEVYDKELKELNKQLTDLEKKYKNVECSTFEPDVKKTYNDLHDLEMDNFKTLPGVEEGDYAKLTVYTEKHKDKYINPINIFYRRVILKNDIDNKEFWVKDKEMTYNLCADENKLGDHVALTKQKCVYDDKEKLCKVKELYFVKNSIENLKIRKKIIEKLQNFHKNYGKIKLDQQHTLEWLKQMLDLSIIKSSFELSYENEIDYTDFIGDAGAEDEDKFGHGEVGEGIKYTVLKTTKDDDEDFKRKPKIENENFAELLIKQFGIVITDNDLNYIIRNQEYYNNETSLNHLIQVKRNEINKGATGALNKYKTDNPKDDDDTLKKIKRFTDKLNIEKEKRLLDMETTYRGTFYKNSILSICALFIIVVQIKLPDVSLMSGFTNCMKDFGLEGFPLNENSKSLLKYVSCVIKNISSPHDERLTTVYKMTLEQIHAEIKKLIIQILGDKLDETEKLKQIAISLKDTVAKEKSTITYDEWSSYRPVNKISSNDGANTNVVKYFKLLIELSKEASLTEKLDKDSTVMTSYLTNNTFRELYNTLSSQTKHKRVFAHADKTVKTIKEELFNEKEININRISIHQVRNITRIEYDIFDTVLKECLDKIKSDSYWNTFPDTINAYMDAYLSKYNFDEQLILNLGELMSNIDDTKALLIRNSIRNFIFDDLKTILSKIVNLWKADFTWLKKLPQLDKRKKEHAFVLDLLSVSNRSSEISSMIEVDRELHENLKESINHLISHIMYSYEAYDIKSENTKDIKKNIYIYEYIIIFILYSIINTIYPNEFEGMFDITHINEVSTITDVILQQRLKIGFEIGKYILETLIYKIKTNSFDALDINRKHEELREIRKQDIINRLDKLNTDDRKIIMDLQKRNLMKWTDVALNPDDADREPDDTKLEDHKILTKKDEEKKDEDEEDHYKKLNEEEEDENEKLEFKGRDADEDYEEYSDDEIIYEEI
jgi:hypothetical protein